MQGARAVFRFEGIGEYSLSVGRKFLVLLGGGSVLIIGIALYEHYAQTAVHWKTYGGIALICLLTALFTVGFEKHQHLLPRLSIPARIFEQPGQTQAGVPNKLLYVEVVNESEGASIENVNVSL